MKARVCSSQAALGGPRLGLLALSLAGAMALQGCEAVLVGAMAGGSALVVADRRTPGIQIEDKTIELKVGQRARELLSDRAHVNAASYNRAVLLSGEVPTEADRQAMGRAAGQVENVKDVFNELTVGAPSSLSARASDGVLAGKIRAKLIDADDLPSTAFKITVESGVVYVMGLVSESEARRATELMTSVSGVKKVVRMLETIAEEEAARLRGGGQSRPKAGETKSR